MASNRVGDVLGVDVLETADSGKQKYQCVNLVDMESGFQQLEVLRPVGEHAGPPSAESCLEAVHRWVTWLGLPRVLMAGPWKPQSWDIQHMGIRERS